MLTVTQLVESTRTIRSRANPTGPMAITKLAPVPVGQAFAVQARFQALSDPLQRTYDATVVFHGIDFVDEMDGMHPLSVEVTPGHIMYFPRPKMSNQVQVSCQCMDHYFVWQYWTQRAGSLGYNYWQGTVYRRKTPPPPVGRPWAQGRNPGVAGCCKHIAQTFMQLKRRGFLIN